jgi:hypothetical protein
VAEQVVIVCDVCGAPAVASVNFGVHGGGARDGQKFAKDLCEAHLTQLMSNSRKPRRGRRRGSVGQSSSPARKQRATAVGSKPARRRGRPRKSPAQDASVEATAS